MDKIVKNSKMLNMHGVLSVEEYRDKLEADEFARLQEFYALLPERPVDELVRAVKQEKKNLEVIKKVIQQNEEQRELELRRNHCFAVYCRSYDYFITSDDELYMAVISMFNVTDNPEELMTLSPEDILKKYKEFYGY